MEISLISAKEKSLQFCLLIQTSTQGFYDRLLSRGICENAPTKGNVRKITSKTPYEIIQKGCIKEKLRESEREEVRPSGSADDSASLSPSV